MKPNRIDVGSIRREQIVDAAIAVIAEQGIQNLSLSEIEKKTGMARGQLTYYFKAKEDILLGVFDRLIQRMHERAADADGHAAKCMAMPHGWERACVLLTMLLTKPPSMPEFYPLQYTFLAQLGHREDFRVRLANLYETWRNHMAQDFGVELANKKTGRPTDARTLASLVQAILHGLAIQRAADPDAYDRQEMLELVFDLLGNYLRPAPPPGKLRKSRKHITTSTKGQPS
jgi:AcrR family transcriptional regulator